MALQNEDIAERIRELRQRRGNPPQPVVADAVGVSLRTYQNWEAGDAKPSYRHLQKLAEYHGVGEDFILSGPEEAIGTPDPFAGASVTRAAFDQLEEQVDRIEAKQNEILRLLRHLTGPAVDARPLTDEDATVPDFPLEVDEPARGPRRRAG